VPILQLLMERGARMSTHAFKIVVRRFSPVRREALEWERLGVALKGVEGGRPWLGLRYSGARIIFVRFTRPGNCNLSDCIMYLGNNETKCPEVTGYHLIMK
jgi:hypothetical protein